MAQMLGADRPIDVSHLFTPAFRDAALSEVRFLVKHGIAELVDGHVTKAKLTQEGGKYALEVLEPFQRTPEQRLRERRLAQQRGLEPLAPGLPARVQSGAMTSGNEPKPPRPGSSGGHLRSV